MKSDEVKDKLSYTHKENLLISRLSVIEIKFRKEQIQSEALFAKHKK